MEFCCEKFAEEAGRVQAMAGGGFMYPAAMRPNAQFEPDDETALRIFDYRDEVIAFRVAERFDCFPYRNFKGRWTTQLMDCYTEDANTPQLAIALAVIAAQGVK